jgi:hypothetical protein
LRFAAPNLLDIASPRTQYGPPSTELPRHTPVRRHRDER